MPLAELVVDLSPERVLHTLRANKSSLPKTCEALGCSRDDLRRVMTSPEYAILVREESALHLLSLLETIAVETPRNIATLVALRDDLDAAPRDRINAAKALENIFESYLARYSPPEVRVSVSQEERLDAVRRTREALKRAGVLV